MDKVVEFINRRFPNNNGNWMNGNCYYFAVILQTRFPGGEIWYEPVVGHFLYKYNNNFYSWTGIYTEDTSRAFKFNPEFDESLFNRLIRHCIL